MALTTKEERILAIAGIKSSIPRPPGVFDVTTTYRDSFIPDIFMLLVFQTGVTRIINLTGTPILTGLDACFEHVEHHAMGKSM